jgi:thiol-disulfide isomerase/thioredoxin
MSSVVLVARALLVVVFTVAGVAKLADLEGVRETVAAFGVDRRLARPLGTVLPLAELGAALALLPQASARWGAAAALLLLLVFSGGVAYALSRGRTPDCNCFGQVSSARIGWGTLARNGGLAVIAALALWRAPGSSFSAWTSSHVAANTVASVAVIVAALLAVATLHLGRRPAAAGPAEAGLDFGDALAAGAVAPDFELSDLDGRLVSRDALLSRGLPVVMVFASPSCAPCQALIPELARWHAALNERLTLVMVESGVGAPEAVRDQLRAHGDFPVLIEPDRDLALAYRTSGTPTGIAISPEGRIASPPLPGAQHIENLIRTVLSMGGAVPTPAPPTAGAHRR